MLPILLGAGLVVVASLLKQYKTVENFQAAGSGNTDSLEGLSDDLQAKLLISSRATAQQSLKDLQEYKTTNGQQWMSLPQSERDNVEAGANVLRNFIKNVPATTTAATLPLIREQLGDLQTYMVALRRSFDIVQTSINKPSQAAIEANTYLTHTLNVIKAFLYFIDTNESTIMGAFEDPTEVQGVEMEVKKTKDHLSTTRDEILGMQKSVDEYDKLTAKQQANLLNQLYETANPIVSHYAEAQVFVKEIKSGEFQKRREEERQRQAQMQQMDRMIEKGENVVMDPTVTYNELRGMVLDMKSMIQTNRDLMLSVYQSEFDKAKLETEMNDCIQDLTAKSTALDQMKSSINSFSELPIEEKRKITMVINEMFSTVSSDYGQLKSYIDALKAQQALAAATGQELATTIETSNKESTSGIADAASSDAEAAAAAAAAEAAAAQAAAEAERAQQEAAAAQAQAEADAARAQAEAAQAQAEADRLAAEGASAAAQAQAQAEAEAAAAAAAAAQQQAEADAAAAAAAAAQAQAEAEIAASAAANTIYDSSGNEGGGVVEEQALSAASSEQKNEFDTITQEITSYLQKNNLNDEMAISGLDPTSKQALQDLNAALANATQQATLINYGKEPTMKPSEIREMVLAAMNSIVLPGAGGSGETYQMEAFRGYRGVQGFQNYRLQGFQNFQLGRREGFQSRGNPYNQASPSLQQAQEFRLGQMNLSRQTGNFAR